MDIHSKAEISRRNFLLGITAGGISLSFPWRFLGILADESNGQNPAAEEWRPAISEMRWEEGIENGLPFRGYSFDAITKERIEYGGNARFYSGRIAYTFTGISFLDLHRKYYDVVRSFHKNQHYGPSVHPDSRQALEELCLAAGTHLFKFSAWDMPKSNYAMANHCLAISGGFAAMANFTMHPFTRTPNIAFPQSEDFISFVSEIILSGFNYDIIFSLKNADGLPYFEETKTVRPEYPFFKRSNYNKMRSDSFEVPIHMLEEDADSIQFTFIERGAIDDVPEYAKGPVFLPA